VSVFELQTGDSISAFDGGFHSETMGDLDQADPADKAPNRATVWIPTEHVTVNVGAAVWGSSGTTEKPASTSGPPEVDAGIVAQTDRHIHLHTFGDVPGKTPGGPSRTVVRLGTPVTVVKASATGYGAIHTNAIQDDTDIGSAYPQPYNGWDGYAMVTEGGAYQESQENHLIVSGKADLRLAGQRTVLLGTPGQVHIMADGAQGLASIVRNAETDSAADSRIDGPGKWVGSLRPETLFDAAMTAVAAGLALAAALDMACRIRFARSPTVGFAGWAAPAFGDWAALVLQFAAAGGGLVAAGLAVKPLAPGGDVTVYASGSYKAVGAFSASMHGGVMTTVSGGALNLVSADAIMSVSSLAISSLSGTFTAVSGLKSVGVSSQWGTVKVNGRESSELSSHGKVFVAGGEDVQVNSTDGAIYVHGRKGFYLGCGAGDPVPLPPEPPKPGGPMVVLFGPSGPNPISEKPSTPVVNGTMNDNAAGYGIWGTPDQLWVGHMQKANNFTSPDPDKGNTMLISKDKIIIKYTNTLDKTNPKTVNLTLDDSGATISGKRICLG
jgi:hypothetical protein